MLEPASLGLISGAALVGAAGMQAALGAQRLRQGRRAAGRRTEDRRQEFAEQLEAAMNWARASQVALRAWTGTRPFRVSAVVDEAVGYRSYYLMPEDGRPLARFEPGQYLTFHLPTADRSRPLVRCYSLSERPREDFYRVTIKRVPAPDGRPDLPPGRASNYFHHEVRPGSLLQVEAPQGGFFIDPTNAAPVVLVGAGVGVTPLMSMAAALAYGHDKRPMYFFAGFRSSREHPFRARFRELGGDAPNLRVDVCYSQPLPTDRLGRDYDYRGRVDLARLQRVLPSSNFRYFVCGPARMMHSLVPELLNWGVPEDDIHYEAFGPASVAVRPEHLRPCEVQFARSGKLLRWSSAAGSLLELAEQGGVPLDSGCRAGSCGQCRVQLAAGRVKHAKKPGVELVEGECLACIARPDGDLVVEA